tara:strand:+ start:2023 stop:2838 length:816 start_codon:yes stop_codon:yes gene_type:complete
MENKPPKYFEMIYIDELSSYSDPELRAMGFSQDGPCDKHKQIMSETPVHLNKSSVQRLVDECDSYMPPPPENDSLETLAELYKVYERNSASSLSDHDSMKKYHGLEMPQLFADTLKGWGYDPSIQELSDLLFDAEIVCLNIQYKYNRPRPYQLAEYYGMPLNIVTNKDMDSPSYPCLEHVQAALLALRCGQYVNFKRKKELVKLTAQVARAKLMGACNFPSDTSLSLVLATHIFGATSFGEKARVKETYRQNRKLNRRKNKSRAYNRRTHK